MLIDDTYLPSFPLEVQNLNAPLDKLEQNYLPSSSSTPVRNYTDRVVFSLMGLDVLPEVMKENIILEIQKRRRKQVMNDNG